MFTDVLDTPGSSGLLANLARAASKHRILCVVFRDESVENLAQTAPIEEDDAWTKAAACHHLVRRRTALAHMRARGITVLETPPDKMSLMVVQKFLEIRQVS